MTRFQTVKPWGGSCPLAPGHVLSSTGGWNLQRGRPYVSDMPRFKKCFSGWWYTDPSEKYEFVSWDDSSQYMEKVKNVPNHQPLLLYPKILQFDTVYHHFPLQVWGIRHFWTNKNVAEGKKGNRWAFHTKQETCSSVGFDFPEEECNMMGRKFMFQIENGRIWTLNNPNGEMVLDWKWGISCSDLEVPV